LIPLLPNVFFKFFFAFYHEKFVKFFFLVPFWKEDDIFPLIELKIKTKRENNMNKNNCFIDDITKDK